MGARLQRAVGGGTWVDGRDGEHMFLAATRGATVAQRAVDGGTWVDVCDGECMILAATTMGAHYPELLRGLRRCLRLQGFERPHHRQQRLSPHRQICWSFGDGSRCGAQVAPHRLGEKAQDQRLVMVAGRTEGGGNACECVVMPVTKTVAAPRSKTSRRRWAVMAVTRRAMGARLQRAVGGGTWVDGRDGEHMFMAATIMEARADRAAPCGTWVGGCACE